MTDSTPPVTREIVLSGIRATGGLHVGNLLGALRHFVSQQEAGNLCLYFIADIHTLTTLKDPRELRGNVLEIVKDYLAMGLDPEHSIIYAQSSVPEIPYLCLLLAMTQPLGELERIPTFKEKVRTQPDNVNLGLITYPVLMAADILGVKATLVPVGEDQVPNLELARNLAERFNSRFGDTFPLPQMLPEMVKVPGLDGGKMGKSDAANAVPIHASRAEVLQLYQNSVTDPARGRRRDPGNPEDCRAVFPIHKMVTPAPEVEVIAAACRTAELGCVDCKVRAANSLANFLEPFQARRAELASRDDYAREVLHEGGKKAQALFAPTLAEVQEKMGLRIH